MDRPTLRKARRPTLSAAPVVLDYYKDFGKMWGFW